MNNIYKNLHQIERLDRVNKNGIKAYIAIISHLGLSQLKLGKVGSFQKQIEAGQEDILLEFIDAQFAKWDRKWKGAYPGPTCDYDANIPTSPTGFTWKELEMHRNNIARQSLALKGIFNPSYEMFFIKHIPTYHDFFDIKPNNNQHQI